MRTYKILIVFLFSMSFLTDCTTKQTAEEQIEPKTNVLMIVVDDLNDWIGTLKGHRQTITPNIDSLSKKATVFRRAYCTSPMDNVSRSSLLTGVSPYTLGTYNNETWVKDSVETMGIKFLPEYLKSNGYETIAIGNIFNAPLNLKSSSDTSSWSEVIELIQRQKKVQQKVKLAGAKAKFLENFGWGKNMHANEDIVSSRSVEEFLSEQREKPFLLACGISKPHLPWVTPEEFMKKFEASQIQTPKVLENDLADLPSGAKKIISKSVHNQLTKSNQWNAAVAAYLGSVNYADHCVGLILDALEKSPHADNTVVILLGDNGFHLGEKSHWANESLWERATHIPLIIKVPGQKPSRNKSVVSLLDVYPTILEILDIRKPDFLEGNSLFPLIENSDSTWNRSVKTYLSDQDYAIRDKQYRFIHYSDGSMELYDHFTDPHEWNNHATDIQFSSILDKYKNL